MTDPTEVLRATELFGLLSDDVLEAVVAHSDARDYARDEKIFQQGDEGDSLFILEEGAVRIVNPEGAELATLGPPATFGELGIMKQQRTATAEAIEQSRVRAVARDSFLELMRDHPSVSDALYRAVGEIVQRVLDRTEDPVVLDVHGPAADPQTST